MLVLGERVGWAGEGVGVGEHEPKLRAVSACY